MKSFQSFNSHSNAHGFPITWASPLDTCLSLRAGRLPVTVLPRGRRSKFSACLFSLHSESVEARARLCPLICSLMEPTLTWLSALQTLCPTPWLLNSNRLYPIGPERS